MTRNKFTLSNEELKELEWVITHDRRAEVVQRATVIRLLHLGHPPNELAGMFLVDWTTIYNWHKRWHKEGIEGLANQPRSGRPPKADAEYCRLLDEAVEQPPSVYGYDFAIWTVERLAQHLDQQTGIGLSSERLRVLMAQRGYVYRRPKHDLTALQDAAARADAMQLLDELKKEPPAAISSCSLWTKPR
jgi:transposase